VASFAVFMAASAGDSPVFLVRVLMMFAFFTVRVVGMVVFMVVYIPGYRPGLLGGGRWGGQSGIETI
jgi:hypothetical protein